MVTIQQLIALGAHLPPYSKKIASNELAGLTKSKKGHIWTTRSERVHADDFLLGNRMGQKIFDLEQTIVHLRTSLRFVQELSQNDASVLFVLPQVEQNVKLTLRKYNQYYICDTWLGGLLTNYARVSTTLSRKGNDYFLPSMPDAVLLLNSNPSVCSLVVQETHQLHIPLIALLPSHFKVPYPIACRSNSPLLLAFFRGLFLTAVIAGKR